MKAFTREYVQPLIDILEQESAFVVYLDLPAVSQKDIYIEVENNTIYLKAFMHLDVQPDEHILNMDFSEEVYAFEVELAECVDVENLKTHLQNGVLIITLPYKSYMKEEKKKTKACFLNGYTNYSSL